MIWNAQVLTLFPDMFPGVLGQSLSGNALKKNLWKLDVMDIRSVAKDNHHTVDDTPYGGGAGMVMKPDIVSASLQKAKEIFGRASRRIYLSPRGKVVDQSFIENLIKEPSVLFLCGRYEGIDQRAIDKESLEEVSLGDFVLAGGEIATMAILEACIRLIPNVLGNKETVKEESFSNGLLEYPHYTKPQNWEGYDVPNVLLSGNHEKIKEWRFQQSKAITKEKRPDLWDNYKKMQKK